MLQSVRRFLPSKKTVVLTPAMSVLLLLTAIGTAFALSSPFKNFPQIAHDAGFDNAGRAHSQKKLKIAILDNGFKNYKNELGKTLPAGTLYHAGPVAVDPASEESHGLFMAQLLSGLLTNRAPGVSYELDLYSAFGYSNFEAAVNAVIKGGFDIVLYSQVWEYGGNGDGRGFINTLVNKATTAGITWVNASGNFGDATYRAPIDIDADGWSKLPGPNQSVRIRCEKNTTGKCPLRVVLSWNDFKDDVTIGTDKDLDLIVTDDTLKIVASSAYQQMIKIPNSAPPGASLFPREIVQVEVTPGLYYIRAKARSQNFNKAKDELRLTMSGDHLTFQDHTPGETLLAPADNAGVISIGASDSEKSSSSFQMQKPELMTNSLVTLLNGDQYKGSSNSAAIAAAAVAVVKAQFPDAQREELIARLGGSTGPTGNPGDDALPLEELQFAPTRTTGSEGQSCFARARLTYTPPALVPFLRNGGIAVQSTMGIKIFTPDDPFHHAGVMRVTEDDMLIVNQNGLEPLPRTNQPYLPAGNYEIVQTPQAQTICAATGGDSGSTNSPNRPAARYRAPTLHLPAR